MHASGRYLIAFCCTLVAALPGGCRTPRADRSVQVTQHPTNADPAIDEPPTRLAYSKKLAAEDALTGTATASINDDGQTLSTQTAQHDSNASPSEQEREFLEAFRDADPRIREAARRRMLASQQTNVQINPLPDLPTRSELDEDPFAAPLSTPPETIEDSAESFVMPASHSTPSEEPADAIRPAPSNAGASTPLPQPEPLLEESASQAAEPAATESPAAEPAATESQATAASAADAQANDAQAALSPAGADPQAADSKKLLSAAELSEEKLVTELLQRYASTPEDADDTTRFRHQMRHRILLMLSGSIDEAVEPIEGLDSSEQEFLRHQLLAMWTAIDPQGHPVPQRRWSTALPHMREATSHMAAATGTLEVRSLAFCTEVESFGRITPFESTRFKAGQQVILYSEVDGFAAERLSSGYETQFQGSYEIFDASGKRLYQKVLPADQQVCNNYRRDYFIAYRLHLPSQLASGKYRMELTMEDIKGKKYGQSSIDFEINGSVPEANTGG